jgi:hypothetical protein
MLINANSAPIQRHLNAISGIIGINELLMKTPMDEEQVKTS